MERARCGGTGMTIYAPSQRAAQRTTDEISSAQIERVDVAAPSHGHQPNDAPRVSQLRAFAANANAGPHARGLAEREAQLNARPTSATAPLQGVFKFGPTTYDTAEKVRADFKREQLGSSKKLAKSERDLLLNERWQALQDMAASATDYGSLGGSAKDLTGLKNAVANHVNQSKVLASGLPQSLAKTKGKTTVSASGMLESGSTESLPPLLKKIVDALLKSGRAFPKENILKTAKEATGAQGHGFFHEPSLAAELLDSGDVMIQLGVVPPIQLPRYLGFDPVASKTPAKGFVGGDVTVWERPPTSAMAVVGRSTFIQAKTANRGTVKDNVMEASNQLAGLTASGDPVGKEVEREHTFTGPTYEGAIYVTLLDPVDTAYLAKIANDAMQKNPAYVSRVVFKYALDGSYFEVTASNKKESLVDKKNPLARGGPQIKKSAASSSKAASFEDYGDHEDYDYEEEQEALSDEEIDRRLDRAEYWADF